MPQELPGFYYDAEKNRYFPLKGPIPGSSRPSSSSTNDVQNLAAKRSQATKFGRRTRVRISKLLQGRELDGNMIDSWKGRCSFMEESLKIQASQPMVWKYQGTEKMGDSALDHMHINTHTPEGQTEIGVLITGSANGSLSIFEVGKVGQQFGSGIRYIPDCIGPVNEGNKAECGKAPGHIWRPAGASVRMSSNISFIKQPGKEFRTPDDGFSIQRALITTLGSERSGGSVYFLDIVQPLDLYSRNPMRQLIHEVASFSCTIWTADCDRTASQAVIGTNLGAAHINLETGTATWTCRSKSDVLAQQLDQSGNLVLCGLRNGAIVTLDIREKKEGFSYGLVRRRIPCPPLGNLHQTSCKKWFELRGNIDPSCTWYMPSSICCLVSLRSYDQYFLASSMDGSIKLYDHRLVNRGAVQTYEGNMNSHSRIQIGVDQSERFLMAGGEDCKLRLWSLKSGELLSEGHFSDSVVSTICWERAASILRTPDEERSKEDCSPLQKNSWGTWCGSHEGLFYVHWL